MRGLLLLPGLVACAPADHSASVAAEIGLDRYVGVVEAAETVEEDGVTTATFDVESGPRCMRGDPFRASVREGSSDDLLVFLQGGGACFSELCLAVVKAPSGMPGVDVLDTVSATNPFRYHDVAYAPYCDGSMFSGDAEVDEDGDGTVDRYHKGLANLTATLELAKERFPEPPRVVLAGSSGGA